MTTIKAVFFDIDGTLVPFGQRRIHPSTLDALQRLKQKGIKTYIATGRALTTFRFAYEQFDFDGYIAMNGQYCVHHHEVIRAHPLDVQQIKAILPFVKENQITVAFAEKDYLYINEAYPFYTNIQRRFPRPDPVDDLKRLDEHDTYQLIMYMTNEQEDELVRQFPYFKPVRWNPRFADVVSFDSGKEEGINAICEQLGITRHECMAFGDGGNDIGMLHHVGIGVAMGNSSDYVKQAADYVTDNDIADGILKALWHFKVLYQEDVIR